MEERDYFFHGVTTDHRRFTLCARENGDFMNVTIALCSHKDNFCKKIGRDISRGRLEKARNFNTIPRSGQQPGRTLFLYGRNCNNTSAEGLIREFWDL